MTGRTYEPGVNGWMVGRPSNGRIGRAIWWCGPNVDAGYSMTKLTPTRRCPAVVWPDAESAHAALMEVFTNPAKMWEQGYRIVEVVRGMPRSMQIAGQPCTKPRCDRFQKSYGLCGYHLNIMRALQQKGTAA